MRRTRLTLSILVGVAPAPVVALAEPPAVKVTSSACTDHELVGAYQKHAK
jgi:hypothetical protein